MKLFLTKKNDNTLIASYDSDYEKVIKLKVGKEYQCEIKRPRNIKFHRKFFALINMVFQNQESYKSIDSLREDLIKEAGHYEEWIDFKGNKKIKAKSIKFAEMNKDEFEILYNSVIDITVRYFNFEKQDIIDNIEEFF
ncbi:hypothetical protein [uncultured Mediterranean phage uvMED]|nr:hypothetical protein [uncultured Mediterranean phage uvMED]